MTNTPPFAIGQPVVALIDASPIIKDNIYTVENCFQCPKCGRWHVLLKEFPVCGEYVCTSVLGCNHIIMETKYGGLAAIRFAPIQETRERIKYVAVSETLREKAQEVVVESCGLN